MIRLNNIYFKITPSVIEGVIFTFVPRKIFIKK